MSEKERKVIYVHKKSDMCPYLSACPALQIIFMYHKILVLIINKIGFFFYIFNKLFNNFVSFLQVIEAFHHEMMKVTGINSHTIQKPVSVWLTPLKIKSKTSKNKNQSNHRKHGNLYLCQWKWIVNHVNVKYIAYSVFRCMWLFFFAEIMHQDWIV